MIHCFVSLLSVRDGDFHHGDRVGQLISLHYPPKQHTKYAALHLPGVCTHTWISDTDNTFPPTPLAWHSFKSNWKYIGAKKTATDTVPGCQASVPWL